MASSALEAKINKIRQQNEEIRRRYEEVEEDKKNAAKLNALVQMVPSSDWPERKEPPEFLNPPKAKQKPAKEKHEYVPQSHVVEGKKIHTFAQGEGPPPDPKYNFLADSEREEPSIEHTKESPGIRIHNRITRGNFRKKTGDREIILKNNRVPKGNYKDDSQPGYDAWRAERNRIDEDRISRQRTAEGNWRREWDNDKAHLVDDAQKNSSRPILGNFVKKDYKDSDRRYNNNEHTNHSRGGSRPYRGSSKNFYSAYDNRSHNAYDQHRNSAAVPVKTPLSPTTEDRTVIATDKSLKVTVNQPNLTKGPVMSVKVNSPSIAGTGRVGPRQRTRVTYSHSDAEVAMAEGEPFHRQKSFEDKSKGTFYNNQKSPNIKRSHSQKKKEGDSKYPNSHRHDSEFRSYSQKDSQKFYSNKSPKPMRRNVRTAKQDSPNASSSEKLETEECWDLDAIKLESNETEDCEISKSVPANETDAYNAENAEGDTKDEIMNEAVFEQEIEESSSTSLLDTANLGIGNEDVNTKDEITNDRTSEKELEENSSTSLLDTENLNVEKEVNVKDEITNDRTSEKELEENSSTSLLDTENLNVQKEVNVKDEITNDRTSEKELEENSSTSLLDTENLNVEKEVNVKDEITNDRTPEKGLEESSSISLLGSENLNIENNEVNIKDEATNEKRSEKELEENSSISLSARENSSIENKEVNMKDDITNEITPEKKLEESFMISSLGTEKSSTDNMEVNMKDEITKENTSEKELEENSLISLAGTENSNIENNEVNIKDEATNEKRSEKELEENSSISLSARENSSFENKEVNMKAEITNEITPEKKLEESSMISSLATEKSNTDNVEVNMKDEITKERTPEKEVEENSSISLSGVENLNIENQGGEYIEAEKTVTKSENEVEESSSNSLLSTENPEPITKEDIDKEANDVTKNLKESSDKSSDAPFPNTVESEKELVLNESNYVPDDTVKLEEVSSSTDDQQSSKQDSEQFVNDNCDNIKDEATEQRSTQVTSDDRVSSLEAEKRSVIEVKNQSICSDEAVKEDASVVNEKTDESDESFGKDSNYVADKKNDKVGNTTEESKEESGEADDNKQEL